MASQHFSTRIDAPRQRVWDLMLGPETFSRWAGEFAEGSYYEGSWEAGQKIRFLTPDGRGLTAVIAENRPFETVAIRHRGIVDHGVDDTDSDAVHAWATADERYTFVDVDGGTEVRVDMDVPPDFPADMADTWPRALARLKALCEERA